MERIEKFLSRHGICSRQDTKKILRQKRIKLNGKLVTKSLQIDPHKDIVTIDDNKIEAAPNEIFILLNKPKGFITSRRDPGGQPTVYELLPLNTPSATHAVGRLDLDSRGLLLFVNDGTLTHRLTHPKHHVEKEYEIVVEGNVDPQTISTIEKGIELDSEFTKPCRIKNIQHQETTTSLNILLTEGKYRQIRRVFEKFNHRVTDLKRIRFGKIELADLPEGKTRFLTEEEINYIKNV